MGEICEPLSINQEDPHDEKVCNSNYGNFLLVMPVDPKKQYFLLLFFIVFF